MEKDSELFLNDEIEKDRESFLKDYGCLFETVPIQSM